MNKPANERRMQILNFIRSRVEVNAAHPTLEEIAAACGLASRSAAQKHVKALKDSGELEDDHGKARSARPKQRKAVGQVGRELFEVSSRDISGLSDAIFRELVARLCSARLADAGLPTDPVTWGGDQRAPDGGIDVRVQLTSEEGRRAGFPRGAIGIQVKATKMGVKELQKEMCPGGLLKPSIRELIRRQGSYWIATTDSAADVEYNKRVAAMKAAAGAEPSHDQAEFDYYDAQRLADWANRHPGIVAWLRIQLGRPLQGWKGLGQWADARGGPDRPFLPDEKHRLSDPQDRERSLTLLEGLVRVRQVLRVGGSSVRLTGLSGVGKTRFAQALFEDSAVPDALPAELAVYTDTGHSPNPSPLALLDELLATQRRAVLIVDNCGSLLHKELTERCKVSKRVSLLTVEYDIREDLPLETHVFQLDGGSSELIEKVINQQFPHIAQVNARKITEFAEGNSRVAIALASTMSATDSLAGLTDRDLFDRLFWLGKQPQEDLKAAAEACSLVYSFNGEELDGELKQLANLIGATPSALYRRVSELQSRGLAQHRGPWRAILPHAIANTLAADALKNVPPAFINQLLVAPQDRLLRSFSRRLGYLHASPIARGIVRNWLSEGGLLGDVAGLSALLLDVLFNVAPVDPAAALQAIKRSVMESRAEDIPAAPNMQRSRLVRLIRLIAYEARFFDECLDVLLLIARRYPDEERDDSTRDLIASLFMLYLSGTHATLEQRARWIRQSLSSNDPLVGAIGIKALSSALESHHFSSHYDFGFGARVRDYGAYPRGGEVTAWFETFIGLAAEVAHGTGSWADKAKGLLAQHFRSLWTNARMAGALESAVGPLLDAGWERGWLAIRTTIRFDSKGMSTNLRSKLNALEKRARPHTLMGRIRAVVLSGQVSIAEFDYADGESPSEGYARAEELARELGRLVAADSRTFFEALPEIVTNQQGRQWSFGAGLGDASQDVSACWEALLQAFEATPVDIRNVQALRGFLSAVFDRDRMTFDVMMDQSLTRQSLVTFVPALQMSAPLDDHGCARLLKSMDNPAVPAWEFQYLAFGRTTQAISDDRLAELLKRLTIKPNGVTVATGILYMHIYDNPNEVGPLTTAIAREVVAAASMEGGHHRHDHELGGVIEKFLAGTAGESAARTLLGTIRTALERHKLSRYDMPESLAELFRVQPNLALDILVGDQPGEEYGLGHRAALAGGRRSGALARIPIDALLQWCVNGPSSRWISVAPLVPAFESGESSKGLRWSERALALLRNAPAPEKVAERLVDHIEPNSWSGSRAEAIRQRLPLLDELETVLGPKHAEQVSAWRNQLTLQIEREARRELEEHRSQNERFE